jgi:hypothetical protein
MKTALITIFFLFVNIVAAKEKYLIFTTEKYKESIELQRFINYRSNDFDVEVAVNSEIGNVWNLYKVYILNSNPDFVLLIGNYNDFPSKTIPYSKPVESFNFWVSEQTDSLFHMQIPIGLFLVVNEMELDNIISKTIRFEQYLEEIPKKLYTHSGGTPDEPVEPWPLEFNDEILNEMYDSFFKENGYLHKNVTSLDDTPNDAQSDIQAFNNGVKYILYHGHGNIAKWSYGMGVEGIQFLTNTEIFPVVFSAACNTGTFTEKIDTLEAPCFATNLISSENGAVAFIGAYNISTKGQNPILYGFSKYVNDKNIERLGDAIVNAFNNTELPKTVNKYYPNVMAYEYNRARLQFHLFGDPALKINSTVSNLNNFLADENFNITPNPAYDYIEISFKQSFKDSKAEIFDIYGNTILAVDIKPHLSEKRIDLSKFSSGTYILKYGKNTEKFVVEK